MSEDLRKNVGAALNYLAFVSKDLREAVDKKDLPGVETILNHLGKIHKFLGDAAPRVIVRQLVGEGKLNPFKPAERGRWKPFWAE